MPRSEEFIATFKLGSETRRVAVETDFADGSAATIAGTVLFAPLILAPVSLAVDAASGANLAHSPNPVTAFFDNAPARSNTSSGLPPQDDTQAPIPQATQEAAAVAEATRAALAYPVVPGSPPLFEGSSYAAFSRDQINAYCQQNWSTRTGASGRTEYNPCTQRSAFR